MNWFFSPSARASPLLCVRHTSISLWDLVVCIFHDANMLGLQRLISIFSGMTKALHLLPEKREQTQNTVFHVSMRWCHWSAHSLIKWVILVIIGAILTSSLKGHMRLSPNVSNPHSLFCQSAPISPPGLTGAWHKHYLTNMLYHTRRLSAGFIEWYFIYLVLFLTTIISAFTLIA